MNFEVDFGKKGDMIEWDDYIDEMEKVSNITIYDYKKIYSVCEFEPKDSGEFSADCGGWKVAKTKHSEDDDKK